MQRKFLTGLAIFPSRYGFSHAGLNFNNQVTCNPLSPHTQWDSKKSVRGRSENPMKYSKKRMQEEIKS